MDKIIVLLLTSPALIFGACMLCGLTHGILKGIALFLF